MGISEVRYRSTNKCDIGHFDLESTYHLQGVSIEKLRSRHLRRPYFSYEFELIKNKNFFFLRYFVITGDGVGRVFWC